MEFQNKEWRRGKVGCVAVAYVKFLAVGKSSRNLIEKLWSENARFWVESLHVRVI